MSILSDHSTHMKWTDVTIFNLKRTQKNLQELRDENFAGYMQKLTCPQAEGKSTIFKGQILRVLVKLAKAL